MGSLISAVIANPFKEELEEEAMKIAEQKGFDPIWVKGTNMAMEIMWRYQ